MRVLSSKKLSKKRYELRLVITDTDLETLEDSISPMAVDEVWWEKARPAEYKRHVKRQWHIFRQLCKATWGKFDGTRT